VRLHKAIKEKDKEALRGLKIKKENKKEKDIEYSILLSENAICTTSELVTTI
jgi:hypothetical protein